MAIGSVWPTEAAAARVPREYSVRNTFPAPVAIGGIDRRVCPTEAAALAQQPQRCAAQRTRPRPRPNSRTGSAGLLREYLSTGEYCVRPPSTSASTVDGPAREPLRHARPRAEGPTRRTGGAGTHRSVLPKGEHSGGADCCGLEGYVSTEGWLPRPDGVREY